MADMSLDDIIKKKKPQIAGMKGRGGIRKGQPRGSIRQNVSPRVAGRVTKPVTDARFKIIQKNREKLTDARDKLAEIAKQSDARLKLEKIRATNNKKKPNIQQQLSGISRKTGRNGKVTLSTNRLAALMPVNNYNQLSMNNYSHQNHQQQHYHQQQSQMQQQQQHHQMPRNVSYRRDLDDPRYHDMEMDYMNDDYIMDSAPIRRTVANDYTPSLPPPPPVFGINKSAPGYSWPKQQQNHIQSQPVHQNITRSVSMRKIDHDRPRELKVIQRTPIVQKSEPAYRENWAFGSRTRTILADEHEDKYFEQRNNVREPVGKIGRLETTTTTTKPRTIGTIVRAKTTGSSGGTTTTTTGYRIVVSNLQANVTQEDIKELFEDVGELLVSRLVRAGTAEVIYKTLKDAKKAVDTYHNRQLDGHPMKCLLVNPRPKNNPTAPAVRPLLDPRRSSSSSFVQPNIGAVHRALFDDGHK